MGKSLKKGNKISDLIPDTKNFNLHSTYGTALVEKSLRKFGMGRSILIDKNNRIIAGNATVEGAAGIGIEDLQIVESDGKRIIAVKRTDIDLDTPQGRELALADNASAKANIVFDAELVVAELTEVVAEEWGIEQEEVKHEAEEDGFNTPEGGIDTDIILGDLFEMGQHRLLCGDSTDSDQVAKLMNGELADMVFTDPPYGVKYTGGTKKWVMLENDDEVNMYAGALPMIYLFTKENMTLYCAFADAKAQSVYSAIKDSDFEPHALIIWNKNHAQFGSMGSHYKQKHEPIIYGWKRGKSSTWSGPNNEVTVWDIKRESKNEFHPTQKPIELVSKAMNNSSKVGSLLFEPFGGSGSTMVASHQMKRKCYTMEIEPKYCQVIIDRMQAQDPSIEIKRNGQHYTGNSKAKE